MKRIAIICICILFGNVLNAQNEEKMKYQIELISHPLCPFNQRCIIALEEKGLQKNVDFKVTYVDLANIPHWFYDLSPQGAMPVLRVNNSKILNKAVIITEFLDDITPATLFSNNSLSKAYQRDWVNKTSENLNAIRDVYVAKDKNSLDTTIAVLFRSLERVESELRLKDNTLTKRNEDGYLNMVEVAYAPFFRLFFEFDALKNHPLWSNFPLTKKWGESLVTHQSVIDSECADYSEEFQHFFKTMGSYFPKN